MRRRDESGAISAATSASSVLVPLWELNWVLPKPSATRRVRAIAAWAYGATMS